VSLQQKLMKQRQQELLDKNRPNTSRPLLNSKSKPVMSVNMLEKEFDEEGNEIVDPARQSRQDSQHVFSEGPVSARTSTHRGQPIQDALYGMSEQLERKRTMKLQQMQVNE